MIACGNVILQCKITGASRGPPPTLMYVNATINCNLNVQRYRAFAVSIISAPGTNCPWGHPHKLQYEKS